MRLGGVQILWYGGKDFPQKGASISFEIVSAKMTVVYYWDARKSG